MTYLQGFTRCHPLPSRWGRGGRSIAKVLTLLAALEAEEHAYRVGASDTSRRELALLESNVDTRLEAMMDYYAKMESSFDTTTESKATARSKRSRLPSYLISPLQHCSTIATYAIYV